MAQIKLARGSYANINNKAPEDGTLYIAKDKAKIYTDIGEKRLEINAGIMITGSLKFDPDRTETALTISDNTILQTIDFTKNNLLIIPFSSDNNYYDNQIYCSAANSNGVYFQRPDSKLEVTIDQVQVFIYDAATERGFIPIPVVPEEPTEKDYAYAVMSKEVAASAWTNKETVVTETAQDDTAATFVTANIDLEAAEVGEGTVTLTAKSQPTTTVTVNIQQLNTPIETVDIASGSQTATIEHKNNDYILVVDTGNIETITTGDTNTVIKLKEVATTKTSINYVVIDGDKTQKVIGTITAGTTAGEGKSVALSIPLVCAFGSTPLIYCESNETEFNKIDNINIEANGTTATLTANVTNDIKIGFIDFIG